MKIKFTENEVKEIVREHAKGLIYQYKTENMEFFVDDHYGDFTVTITDKPKVKKTYSEKDSL